MTVPSTQTNFVYDPKHQAYDVEARGALQAWQLQIADQRRPRGRAVFAVYRPIKNAAENLQAVRHRVSIVFVARRSRAASHKLFS